MSATTRYEVYLCSLSVGLAHSNDAWQCPWRGWMRTSAMTRNYGVRTFSLSSTIAHSDDVRQTYHTVSLKRESHDEWAMGGMYHLRCLSTPCCVS